MSHASAAPGRSFRVKTVLADPRSPIPVQFASGTAEEHEFYQARVRLFTGCVFLISGSFYLIGVAFSAPALGVDIAVLWAPKLFHLAATILAGTIWLVLRSPRSMAFLNRLDAAATIVLSTAYALMAFAGLDADRLEPLMNLEPWRATTDIARLPPCCAGRRPSSCCARTSWEGKACSASNARCSSRPA